MPRGSLLMIGPIGPGKVSMGSFFARLRAMSPLGPIVGMEMRATARRKRTHVLRFAYLGGLLLILLLMHVSTTAMRRYGGVAQQQQRNAEMGAIFFAAFGFFTWFAMALVGPVLTATAINSERLRKTLPVLLMTPLTAWQVVSGKLFARLLIALTLIGLSLPVLAVVRLLGGVEIGQMFGLICLCVATVVFTAAIGLIFSTLMNRAYAVILLSYAFLFALWFLAPLMGALFLFEVLELRGLDRFVMSLGSVAHPTFSVAVLVIPERPPAGVLPWHWCALAYFAAGMALVFLCAAILRRMATKENEGARQAATPIRDMIASIPRIPADAAAPPPLSAIPSLQPASCGPGQREVSDNPVLWRELRRPLLNRIWQRVLGSFLVIGAMLILYLLLGAADGLDDSESQIGFAVIFCGLYTLLICVLSATAIAHEKESDTWTLLLATPLSGRQIVWGKAAGLGRRLLWPTSLIVVHFTLFTLFGVVDYRALFTVLWLTITTNVLWLATGLFLSLRLKTVTFAVIVNVLGPVLIYGVAAIVLAIAGELIGHAGEEASEYVGLYAPYVYMASALDSLPLREYGYGSYFARRDGIWMPVNGWVSLATFMSHVLWLGMAHLAAAAGILTSTAALFDQITGRATQQSAAKLASQ